MGSGASVVAQSLDAHLMINIVAAIKNH